MDVLYATESSIDFETMKSILHEVGINLVNLKSVQEKMPNIKLPKILDKRKYNKVSVNNLALQCYNMFKCPTVVIRKSLCFENLDVKYWPKSEYLMYNGKEMTYDEIVARYSEFAKKVGPIKARFREEICFVVNETNIFYDIIPTGYFLIVEKPHKEKRDGCGLDRVSVDINTNQYYYDMDSYDIDNYAMKWEYKKFFKTILDTHNYKIKI